MTEELPRDPVGKAEGRFGEGFNCAQAVFSAFTSLHGMDESTALKLASPLGGGISRRGEICGAVSGALLVLGLLRGSDTPEGKESTYLVGQDFLRRFESMHSAILCRDLTGFDISLPEGREKARQAGVFKSLCPLLVRDAVLIVQAMIEEDGQ